MNKLIAIQHAVFNGKDQPVVTSKEVAKAFKKRHANVLRKIEAIMKLTAFIEFSQLNFESAEYLDEQGKCRKSYSMTKDGFMLLVMGFTGYEADAIKISFINAFNWMADSLESSWQMFNKLSSQHDAVTTELSHAGRTLVILGKQVKPALTQRLNYLVNQLQLPLFVEVQL